MTFLDITASHENRDIILDVVRRTAEACFMPLTVGGGVRTVEDIRKLLASGADKVSINTAAVARRTFVKEAAEKFGDQCIVVAVDAKKVSGPGEPDRWEIFTHGGRNPTGIDAVAYAKEVVALGAGEILLTSMDRDGTGHGFDIALTRAIADAVGCRELGLRRRPHAVLVVAETQGRAAVVFDLSDKIQRQRIAAEQVALRRPRHRMAWNRQLHHRQHLIHFPRERRRRRRHGVERQPLPLALDDRRLGDRGGLRKRPAVKARSK